MVWSIDDTADTASDVLQWDGTRTKSLYETMNDYPLVAITAVSRSDGWAVEDAIAHWDGKRWTRSRPSFLGGQMLLGASAARNGDVWVVGPKIIARRAALR